MSQFWGNTPLSRRSRSPLCHVLGSRPHVSQKRSSRLEPSALLVSSYAVRQSVTWRPAPPMLALVTMVYSSDKSVNTVFMNVDLPAPAMPNSRILMNLPLRCTTGFTLRTSPENEYIGIRKCDVLQCTELPSQSSKVNELLAVDLGERLVAWRAARRQTTRRRATLDHRRLSRAIGGTTQVDCAKYCVSSRLQNSTCKIGAVALVEDANVQSALLPIDVAGEVYEIISSSLIV
jgi:hypothetical protein